MGVKKISSSEDFHTAVKESGVAVVDFFATWCGPCKIIGPHLEELSNKDEYKGIAFLKVDVDEDGVADFMENAGVTAMPTFRIYTSEQEEHVDELIGANKEKLKALLDKAKELEGKVKKSVGKAKGK